MPNSAFGFATPEESPGLLLWQTTVIWQRQIKKALDSYSISHAQFVILAISLWFESQHAEIPQSLIIRQSKLDKMTVSKSLKKLVVAGHIERCEHMHDTRAKTVHLTHEGRKLAAKLVPIVEAIDQRFFSELTSEEQPALISSLHKLVAKTGDIT